MNLPSAEKLHMAEAVDGRLLEAHVQRIAQA